MSNSVWGKSDCLTEILPKLKRPGWLRTDDSVKALANFKKLFNDDVKAGVEWFGKYYGEGYKRIPNDSDMMPNDVIVGKTREYDFAIAKVGKSYHPIIRTEIGYSDANFTEIYAKWRPL